MDAAGHQVIARAFGRRAGHEGRFDFDETVRAHMLAHHLAGLVRAGACCAACGCGAGRDSGSAGASPRRCAFRLRWERAASWLRSAAAVSAPSLPLRRSAICALTVSGERSNHFAFHAHHVFGAHLLRPCRAPRGSIPRLQHHLRDARVVAQIKKDQVAQVAPAVHPAGQKNGLAHVRLAQFAAIVRSLAITQ